MIIPVVVNVDHPVQFRVLANVKLGVTLDTFGQSLSSIFLHLDVEEFPANKEQTLIRKIRLHLHVIQTLQDVVL